MKLPLFLSMMLLSLWTFAQPCGTDILKSLNYDDHARTREAQMNEGLYKSVLSQSSRVSGIVSVIPIVFHVIHENGPENISDSLIHAVVAETNLRLQNAGAFNDSIGHDVQIQICLATVDESGNPTTGIDRFYSPYTHLFSTPALGDFGMKNLTRWSPHLYLNVWVVNSLSGPVASVGAYANYPTNAGQGTDGIVLRYTYANSQVLIHEIGHILGLYHTFNGGCSNFNCLLNGDFVCDTPPDSSNDTGICPLNTCSTEMDDTSGNNPFTTDVNDLRNYMDYSSCWTTFTDGQGIRMNASIVQFRSSLLQSNGCGQHPGGAVPIASFQFVDACPFPYLVATDTNALGGYWDFNSDGIIDDYGKYVSSPFTTVDTFNITMIAVGYGGRDTLSQSMLIHGKPEQHYPMVNGLTGVGGSVYHPGQWSFCQGATVTASGVPGMASYQWSTGDTTQVVSFNPTTSFTLTLSATDSSGHVWVSCFPIVATLAPPTIPPVLSFIPYDNAYCYDDYGDLMTVHADLSPIRYTVNWVHTGGVTLTVPDSANYTFVIQTFNDYFIVSQVDSNGCYSSSQISFDLEYNTPAFNMTQSGDSLFGQFAVAHYKWFLDGIEIQNYDSSYYVMNQPGCYTVFSWFGVQEGCGIFASDTVCKIASSVMEIFNGVYVYPNPTTNILNIKNLNNDASIHYVLTNVTGLEITCGKSVHGITEIDLSEYASGVYFLRLGYGVFKVVKE